MLEGKFKKNISTRFKKTYPTVVVCKWMGNTPSVAHRHYLIVTDEDYAKALIRGGKTGYKLGTQPPASCSDPPSRPRTESHDNSATPLLLSDNASFAQFAEVLENAQVAEEGLELAILFCGKTYLITKPGYTLGIFRHP